MNNSTKALISFGYSEGPNPKTEEEKKKKQEAIQILKINTHRNTPPQHFSADIIL
jgi:hypothetical protein